MNFCLPCILSVVILQISFNPLAFKTVAQYCTRSTGEMKSWVFCRCIRNCLSQQTWMMCIHQHEACWFGPQCMLDKLPKHRHTRCVCRANRFRIKGRSAVQPQCIDFCLIDGGYIRCSPICIVPYIACRGTQDLNENLKSLDRNLMMGSHCSCTLDCSIVLEYAYVHATFTSCLEQGNRSS